MKKFVLPITVLGLLIFVACSQKNTPSKSEPPKVMATTYAGPVHTLIEAQCSPCHLPSKGGNKASFENYESAKRYGAAMVTRIELNPGDRGFMPFKHAKLSAEDIAVFKKWVSDGLQEK